MTRPILAIRCKARDLSAELEASIAALENGARFVDPATLPSTLTINSTHAQLARIIREQRVWRAEP